jgi:thiamine biosynthesis lipoprotein
MARTSTPTVRTLPARLRAIAAVWLAFKILSGTTPALHADLRHAAHASGRDASHPTPASLQRFEFHEAHMGTDTRIVLYASDEAAAGAAARAAFDRVEALNQALSDYHPTSELMQVSARAGRGAVAISDDLFRVLAAAQDLAQRSDGAFDVTCGPLTRLWRRARHVSELPAMTRVDEARALTGFTELHLDTQARTVTLDKAGMSLDVGGIAKGYAAEEALHVLIARGFPRALVALGGDIAVAAPPPDREGWLIDVATLDASGSNGSAADPAARSASLAVGPSPVADASLAVGPKPADDASAAVRLSPAGEASLVVGPSVAPGPGPILLRDAAISTAGDAEQWLAVNGTRYSHILDPRTGWPMTVRSSTTVIARHGLDADGLDTTAAVLGIARGLALVEATPGAAAFMVRIAPDGTMVTRMSSRWPPRVHSNHSKDAVAGSHEPPAARVTQAETPR